MLASKYRLKKTSEIENVKKNGRIYQSSGFGMSILDRKDDEVSRFVIITSKKVSKYSTERNRVKRVFHDTIRYELTRIKPGYDVLFLVKKKTLMAPTDQIMFEIKSSLKNSNLFK